MSHHLLSRHSLKANGLILAATLALNAICPLAFAGPGDINSVNDGKDIAGGNYYNTESGKTTFINTSGSGLTVGAGTTVRGLEVNADGSLTGNGGHLHFYAPGQVVKIDGNVDARAALDGSGSPTGGNGGNVTIDAGALIQNGNVWVSGLNGGVINFNVGSLTVGPNARLEAIGLGGTPGLIDIKATGQVTIPKGAVLDASGNYLGGYNPNVISIQGSVVNLDGVVMANGLGGGNGGNIAILGSEITVGSDASIQANGSTADASTGTAAGNGGRISIGTGDQDFNEVSATNVTNSGNITANGGNGDAGLDAGNGGIVAIGAKNDLINNGYVASNGGQGYNGHSPSNGGHGGLVSIDGDYVGNNGTLAANGGNGGTNPDPARGPVSHGEQFSQGEDGAAGGNGGAIVVSFRRGVSNPGKMEVIGGDGGAGQIAIADADHSYQEARGGNGGDAGTGGLVRFHGLPGEEVLHNVNVSGGSGGQGGDAKITSDCGCAVAGAGGACGSPGQIEIVSKCTDGNCSPTPPGTPPNTPPTSPLFPLYPKEYSTLGDTLPPNVANVLTYNRSIFLARTPMPIVQKKQPPPPPPAPPAKIMLAKPKPKPPQKKVPVRGYW